MHLDHVNISAPMGLLEKTRDFYCEVLGLEVGPRPDFSMRGFWLYAGDQAMIHLSESEARGTGGQRGGFDHFAIRVSGLGDIIEKLEQMGVEYGKFELAGMNLTQVFFRDPTGTRVELSATGEAV